MLTRDTAFRLQMSTLPDDNQDNLFAPMPSETYTIHGEWSDKMRPDSIGTRLFELHPTRARVLAAAAATAALFAVSRRNH